MSKYKTISGPVAVAGLALMLALGACSSGGDAPATDTTDVTPEPHVCDAGPSQACVDAREAELADIGDDASAADLLAAQQALETAKAQLAKANEEAEARRMAAEAAAARQALIDAAMCTDGTAACVAHHEALVEALQADLDELNADPDATNAQIAAAKMELSDAMMARDDVQMALDDANRGTETGMKVTEAEDAAGMLEDNRSAEAIMAAEEALAAAKEAVGDSDMYADEIAAAEMAIARAKERNSVDDAVMAAETAAMGLVEDSSPDAVTAAQGKVDAAEMAIEDAEHLTADEKADENAKVAAAQTTVSLAKNANDEAAKMAQDEADRKAKDEADRKAKEMAAAGKALHKALGDDPLALIDDGSGGTTGAVGIVSGGLSVQSHADASASTPVPAVTLKAGNSVGSLGAWSGMNYAHMNPGTKMANTAVVYSNVAAPKQTAFGKAHAAAENQAHYTFVDSGITATAGQLVEGTKIMGMRFPTAGENTYTPPAGLTEVSFPGKYDGASGMYSCTGATCTATKESTGISLSAGWRFTPATGAMVSQPDTAYLYFGWWLRKEDGEPTLASAFFGEEGDVEGGGTFTDPATITGSATYSGHAAGKFAINNPLGGSDAGHFTADVMLTAKFGVITTPNNGGVSGTVDNFMANDKSVPWSVALNRAPWDGSTPGAFASTATDNEVADGTTWSIDGNAAAESGRWNGQMHDEALAPNTASDGSNVPTTAVGVFHSEFGSTHSMVGGFGATKQ